MRRIICGVVVTCLMLSISVSVFAHDEMVFGARDIAIIEEQISGEFQNAEGCCTETVMVEMDAMPFVDYVKPRATDPAETFWNLATRGIYRGSFWVSGTIYTNRYFDTQDGEYYTRVNCEGDYPSMPFKVGNYCITCRQVLSMSDECVTPSTVRTRTGWLGHRHRTGSAHEEHFMCPFVKNLDDGTLTGDIEVNYTNSWN